MIRLSTDNDAIRLVFSGAVSSSFTAVGKLIDGATVTDIAEDGAFTDAEIHNLTSSIDVGQRADIAAITLNNLTADSNPVARLSFYNGTTDVVLFSGVLQGGQTLLYANGEWRVQPTVDPTRGGILTRAEVDAKVAVPQAVADANAALLAEFPETDPEVAGQVFHDTDKYTASAGA